LIHSWLFCFAVEAVFVVWKGIVTDWSQLMALMILDFGHLDRSVALTVVAVVAVKCLKNYLKTDAVEIL
jgi:DMSO/TMAO reductase YedYZ heme-binding membrane subunit